MPALSQRFFDYLKETFPLELDFKREATAMTKPNLVDGSQRNHHNLPKAYKLITAVCVVHCCTHFVTERPIVTGL